MIHRSEPPSESASPRCRAVRSLVGAVSADGWISGPGARPRDLAVTHWDKIVGNLLFQRAP